MTILISSTRKSLKNRLLIYTMYMLLVIGAISMVYPFLLLLSGSTKSGVDSDNFESIPSFLYSSENLYKKEVEAFLNEKEINLKLIFGHDYLSFKSVELPKISQTQKLLLKEWQQFLRENKIENYQYDLAYMRVSQSKKTQPLFLREFQTKLTGKYTHNLNDFNKLLESEFTSWSAFSLAEETFLERERTYQKIPSKLVKEFRNYKKAENKNDFKLFLSPSNFFIKRYPNCPVKLTSLFNQLPESDKIRKKWLDFVRYSLNPLWIYPNLKNKQLKKYFSTFLQKKYNKNINLLNQNYGLKLNHFSDVKISATTVKMSQEFFTDWSLFIHGWHSEDNQFFIADAEMLKIAGVEFEFRNFLLNKYSNIGTINAQLKAKFNSINEILPPQKTAHYYYFTKNQGAIAYEFVKRNFIAVFSYIFLKGRALLNTVIYCAMAIIFALLINPLAAYCLSRFKPKSSYKILLFFMLTMAFPPMVTQIPVFIMLREFNLLNTFWALVLPTMANGYAIFLLKGFFDSIPQELYESAQIDGANELRIFYQITLSLSKPILAVIALQTFTVAYSNFMMALLICQDQKMWTIMPWLYTLHSNSGEGIIFASLVIAAIPTLLVFTFCQNVIIKGIIVPVEK
ncbi:carbohydrate ABC transporter permease [Lentisphaerota bacterium WC36G]|nr:carbohydrate ABC transporter permease [Lentisphaerae bacterium WC36]